MSSCSWLCMPPLSFHPCRALRLPPTRWPSDSAEAATFTEIPELSLCPMMRGHGCDSGGRFQLLLQLVCCAATRSACSRQPARPAGPLSDSRAHPYSTY
eukprot:2947828-Rhodomonas_salina.1